MTILSVTITRETNVCDLAASLALIQVPHVIDRITVVDCEALQLRGPHRDDYETQWTALIKLFERNAATIQVLSLEGVALTRPVWYQLRDVLRPKKWDSLTMFRLCRVNLDKGDGPTMHNVLCALHDAAPRLQKLEYVQNSLLTQHIFAALFSDRQWEALEDLRLNFSGEVGSHMTAAFSYDGNARDTRMCHLTRPEVLQNLKELHLEGVPLSYLVGDKLVMMRNNESMFPHLTRLCCSVWLPGLEKHAFENLLKLVGPRRRQRAAEEDEELLEITIKPSLSVRPDAYAQHGGPQGLEQMWRDQERAWKEAGWSVVVQWPVPIVHLAPGQTVINVDSAYGDLPEVSDTS